MMPELAEIETIARDLRASDILNKTILKVRIKWPKIIFPTSPFEFVQRIKNKKIKKIIRKGKLLVFQLENLYLLFHLRMTGHIFLQELKNILEKHEHLEMVLEDGRALLFYDIRKFGRLRLVNDLNTLNLGKDPLSRGFTLSWFKENLKKRKSMIKPLLLNQRFIAGLGNIYTDEVLFEAKIFPKITCKDIAEEKVAKLFVSIRKILRQAIKYRGTSLGSNVSNFSSIKGQRGQYQDHLKAYKRKNLPCFKCGRKIKRIRIGQRSSHFCPKCQAPSICRMT